MPPILPISTCKTVRDHPVKARLKLGQIIVEERVNGVIFSFPAAVWPMTPLKRLDWITRLTPWWDMDAPDWSPQAHRLREACVSAINQLLESLKAGPSCSNPP